MWVSFNHKAAIMKLSIFARLAISYLLLFSMLAGVSLFFLSHLHKFNQVIESIILDDTGQMEHTAQLVDLLLAESRFDRKYVLVKDEQLFESYQRARADFTALLDKIVREPLSPESTLFFENIKTGHEHFSRLVAEEMDHITAAEPYDSEGYDREKQRIANELIEMMKVGRQSREENVFRKIKGLREQTGGAARIAIMIFVGTFVTGALIAALITRSIIRPVNLMKAKTKEIAQGNFSGDLEIHSPPAIHELASAINSMCHKLQAVDTIKSDFFSHMSHELRTPLSSIQEGTNLLLEGHCGAVGKRQERILNIVAEESKRLIELVSVLLDLSKMEAGMLEYHFAKADLAALIERSLLNLMPLAEAKSIAVRNTTGLLPAVTVDAERMEQVFRNIIGNALKFTPQHGTVTIEAAVTEQWLEIAVKDTGIGIPRECLESIFTKFRQVVATTGEKVKGTGLGLATVKQIILAHGGKVWAHSQEGAGSSFYIALPLSS